MKVTFHVGLPKTATTYLQKHVFPHEEAISFVHRRNNRAADRFIRQVQEFVRRPSLDRDALVRARAYLVDRAARARRQGKFSIVVSDENITVMIGDFWNRKFLDPERLISRCGLLVDELASDGLEVQYLCLIRRQDNWLASRYAESAKRNEHFSQAGFERYINGKHFRRAVDESVLDYYHLHCQMSESIGSGRVMLLPFERYEDDPARVLQEIAEFVGVDALTEPGEPGSAVNRLRSESDVWRLKQSENSVDAERTLRLTPQLRQQILEAFESSNAKLDELWSGELSKYGYLGA